MNSTFIILAIITGTILLVFFMFRRGNTTNNTKSLPNKNKYLDLINTLNYLDEKLDSKLNLVKNGIFFDLDFFEQKAELTYYLSNKKLMIFGPTFVKAIMEIFEDAEIDEKKVSNASSYVKNELIKLHKLVN
jgi:hypothetical protein